MMVLVAKDAASEAAAVDTAPGIIPARARLMQLSAPVRVLILTNNICHSSLRFQASACDLAGSAIAAT
ncbi:hypothetical protein OKW34_000479 [Paraburkholderia youngii]|uniref:Uncharacterized protein n=1 Tax=Paraburkholderia youngii TaxID=2782701 RepID=A0ABX2NJ37_9BURK|nr:hypothetical protein [Paraburkholderia youngii]NUX57570.1 hypothetical protein [Paraburkholderia youngii]NVI04419.1 hypothetical protein [Paraburkholderia youngii]